MIFNKCNFHRLFYIHATFFKDIQVRLIYRMKNNKFDSGRKNGPILVLGNNAGTTSFLPRETVPYGQGWEMR